MGQQRMNTLVKSLLLRRTKDQKSTVTGKEIVPLPEKETIVHRMKLSNEENKVYQEVSNIESYFKQREASGVTTERVQRVHLHLSIFANSWCITLVSP